MHLKKIILILAIISSSVNAHGQAISCYDGDKYFGNIDELRIHSKMERMAQMNRNRSVESDTVILNPVILRTSDGQRTSAESDVLSRSIEAANEFFELSGIYFQYCGFPTYVNDDEFYNLNLDEGLRLNDSLHVKNTINVYIVRTISQAYDDGTVGLFCGIASFPKPETESRYILLDGACMEDETLLAHELGHFYGLYHTHETAFGTELVNKLNCEIAGDFICDTPADPLLHGSNVVNCRYFGSEVDPIGDAYRPDTKNIMSYAPKGCRSQFSWQQLFRMRDVHENENSYLLNTCDFPDYSIKIDTLFASFIPGQKIELPIVIYNLGSQKFGGFTMDLYLSEDRDDKTRLLTSIKLLFPENKSQLNLRLPVEFPIDLPETDQFLIAEVDGSNSIKELDESNNMASLGYRIDYSNLTDVSLYPNPAGQFARLFLRNESMKGKVLIKVIDSSGRLILSENRIKMFDTFQAEIVTEGLLPGVYFIDIQVEGSKSHHIKMIKF